MYNVTELIAEWDKNNHKKIVSTLVDRKNHSFNSLKELALFSRSRYIFTSYQKEITEVPRNNNAGEKLYIGNNLLWLDLDFEINLRVLRDRLKEHNLKGFAYYTSGYYKDKVSHARLCIVCEETIDKDNWTQVKFYAAHLLNKLKYKVEKKEERDKSIYNLSSYLAKVKGNYEKEDLVVIDGKPFKWIKQESFIKKYLNSPVEKQEKIVQISGFGKIGELAAFFSSLDSVVTAVASGDKTINLSFTKIPEKTMLGYFIKPLNPWIVCHPNEDKNNIYLSNCLSTEDFEKFKEFFLDFNDTIVDPFESSLDTNKIIKEAFVDSTVFKKGELLFLESPTGSGKTTAISEFINENPKKSVLFISVNRMQAVALYRALKINMDVTCYLKDSLKKYQLEKKGRKKVSIYNERFTNEAEQGILPQKLICGVVSLHHLMKDGKLLKHYDYIVIDEISTLPNSVSGPVGLVYERLGSFELGLKALKLLLTTSERVICMDGFLSNTVVKLITDISKKEPYIVKNTIPTHKRVEIHNCSGGQPKFEGNGTCTKYLNKIINDIDKASFGATKRLMVVALSSFDLSETLGKFLEKKYPTKTIQVFNSKFTEKNGEVAIRMFEDLDKYLEEFKIDILIYSPTITTGIDIPHTKGTTVYHIISGDQLSSHTNYQMTMRGRKAKCYRILIAKSLMIDKKEGTSFTKYISEAIQEVKECFPFKTPKSIKWKARNFQTSGLLLAYYRLEYNLMLEDWNKVHDIKSLINALDMIALENNYDLEGVKIGLKIDRALIHFRKELYLKGKNGYQQYINFLKHEKCKISIEEDIDYHSLENKKKYDNDHKQYIEGYIDCWKEEYSELNYSRLFKILKVAKVFYVIRDRIKIGEYSNDQLLDLYETLYKKSFLKEYKELTVFLKKNKKKEKIAFMKSMLSTIFKVESIRYGLIISK